MFCQGKQSVLHNETKCLVKGNSLFHYREHAPVPYKGRTSTICHCCKNKEPPQVFLRRFFVIATGFKPVTGWSVVSYSIQLSYAAIVSWLRVQRYVFVLNMQTFRLLFCEFNLTFLDWRSGNQCLSQSWNSPSDNCIRWRTDWYIRMAIAIRPPLHPYN